MDASPSRRLVDLVHAFNGIVVEQFERGVENFFTASILLWRLLKLNLKIWDIHASHSLRKKKSLCDNNLGKPVGHSWSQQLVQKEEA